MENSHLAPELNAEITSPVHFLEKHFLAERSRIEEWFERQWRLTIPPVYGSVDLRNSGFKLAPIDMNLFPAGFNNLNADFMSVSVSAAKKIVEKIFPGSKRILIIPESHTRNLYYWENVKTLQTILQGAGFDTRLGLLTQKNSLLETEEIHLSSGEKLVAGSLIRENDQLRLAHFLPDFILLNNDLSDGIPSVLENLKQPILPPAELGWSQRLKSEHFQYYSQVVKEFSGLMQIDPWLIDPLFRHCGQIDFMQQEGMESLIHNAETLFAEIQKKYDQYQIQHPPFLIVKADAGTYGIAVMTVRNLDELKSMNRKLRTKMSVTKGGQPVDRVIIQEGVYTFETVGSDKASAEPVVYLWGENVAGGFYRVHQNRGTDENLNAPGMKFVSISFHKTCHEPCSEKKQDTLQNRLYIYGLIAKLSMLAAARELNNQVNSR